jgi:hypothetical protein
MVAPAIFVFEKRPIWEAELKRRFAGTGTTVRPARSVPDLLGLCRSASRSVAVLSLSPDPRSVLTFLEKSLIERLSVCSIVLGSPVDSQLEWSLRELGALTFLLDTTSPDDLARHCARAVGNHR